MSKRNIAIIGSGISGLTCAHLLHDKHAITVFEANDYIGGHTATKQVNIDNQNYAIDTGFIVFNDWTYPNFIKLMKRLNVDQQKTEMSFSVTHSGTGIEYNGHNLNTLFAQRRNIFRPRFHRIVRDIVRFNKHCKTLVEQNASVDKLTLAEFIHNEGFSEEFATHYIYPMCAAIWSASLAQTRLFPMRFFLQFFNNHGLLNISNRPQWYTIVGGSNQYVDPMVAGFKDRILLNTPVRTVAPHAQGGYSVHTPHGEMRFDDVVLACHSDQALAMLAAPNQQQQSILSAIPYASNEVILHTDERLLPDRKLAWASWNYRLTGHQDEDQSPAMVTYNMNILQRIEAQHTFCVTLNNTADIDEAKILGKYHYAHPQFSSAMVAAQQRREEICGIDGLHFCGAYWYNGFHEDGVRSALDVCKRFGVSL